MDNLMQNKCFMYCCRIKQGKLFQVPVNRPLRKKWFEYAGRQDYMIAPNLTFSCETHYNEISNVFQLKMTHTKVDTQIHEDSEDEYPINRDTQMSTICRLCLNPLNLNTRQWYHIFNQHEKMKANENISKMIQKLTGVIIEEDITLPLKLCQTCYKYLCFFNDFKNKCISSNEALQNLKRAINSLKKMEEIRELSEIESTNQFDEDDILFRHQETDEISINNETNIENKHENIETYEIPKNLSIKIPYFHLETYESSLNVEIDKKILEKEQKNVEPIKTQKKLSIKIPCLKKVKCPRCKQIIPSREELKYHNEEKHSATKKAGRPYRCVVNHCKNRYNCLKYLLIHHETNHSDGDPTKVCEYQCKICFKYFSNKKNVRDHMRSIHSSRSLACDICGKKFKTRNAITLHLHRHSGQRNYVCEICSKAFQNPYSLRIHRRIHTGEKPFVCHLCAEAFTYKCSLDAHITKHHSD